MTAAPSRSTPAARSFAASPAPGGPPSTSTAGAPRGCRRIASPCPTSRTETRRPPGGGAALGPPAGLRVSVLDVGQGDAILLQPRGAPAVLVDGGPPGAGVE